MKAIKRTQKEVAFAEIIIKVLQICVLRMELKIPEMDGIEFRWNWNWITVALANSRKDNEKGRSRMEEEMVWESLRLRMEKNSDSGGNPAASKRDRSRVWTERESGRRELEMRMEVENGRAKMAAKVK